MKTVKKAATKEILTLLAFVKYTCHFMFPKAIPFVSVTLKNAINKRNNVWTCTLYVLFNWFYIYQVLYIKQMDNFSSEPLRFLWQIFFPTRYVPIHHKIIIKCSLRRSIFSLLESKINHTGTIIFYSFGLSLTRIAGAIERSQVNAILSHILRASFLGLYNGYFNCRLQHYSHV
jgi:hypothetical protein